MVTLAPAAPTSTNPQRFLPTETPLALLDAGGHVVADAGLVMPSDDILLALHRKIVLGRRFDSQATALTKQGRLAVYPSARGQEAGEIGAVVALRPQDWLFPTYRDSMAVVARGVDPVEVLALLRGDWHCGYDPYGYRVAPQCTPLATNALHAVGLAHAARIKGEDTVALVMLGDGATSEGDTHEALNFAAVWKSPVVFFVQNNGYAISVPLSKQSAAPSLAHKGVGYGMPSMLIDGNDPAAVYAAVAQAVAAAAAGEGPTLIEAITYRIEAHTNADDATRYRDRGEVESWLARDPLTRLRQHLTGRGLLDEAAIAALDAEAETEAAALRQRMNVDTVQDPAELFRYVYAEQTPALGQQQQELARELAESEDQ
ncbi:MAG: 2-oxoisovalerate dehydrogenase component alpha subunit [Pseudonocardiales bacterium]|nr:2-oxoisovalerate dehydrogenase component alpha subunit [Pseudonocardiales bacterium]